MSVSTRIFLAGSVLFLTGALLGQQPAPPPVATPARGKISGTVTKAGTGEPVRKASVTLMPAGGAGGQGNRGQAAGAAQAQPTQPGQIAGPGQIAPANLGQQPAPQAQAAGQAPPRGQNNQQGQRGGGGGARSVTTGDDGSFTFPDVAAGTYRVRVDRDGFLSQEYGQRSWTGTGIPVTVQPNQTVSNLTFQLVQGGTIAGRILDENLEPVAGIQVQSLTYAYQNGSRTLVSDRQVQTDDRGEYRLYWLTPGDHYVSAIPNARRGGLVQAAQPQGRGGGGRGGQGGRGGIPAVPQGEDGPDETYAAMFYPGGVDPETAAPVRVGAASEVHGIDFVLRPIPTAKVSGRVVAMDITPTPQQQQAQAQGQAQPAQQQGGRGGRGGNNQNNPNNANNNNNAANRGGGRGRVEVLLTRIGASVGGRGGGGRGGGGGGRGGGLGGFQFSTGVGQDGTFEILNVIPGAYNLIAVQQAPGQIFSTRTRLDVGPADIAGINLAVRPGVEVPGQIYLDGTPPPSFQMNRLRVNLVSVDNLPIGNPNAIVDANGKFTLTNVPAMSYRVNLQQLPAGAYIIAGKFGNVEALGDPLQVDQGGVLAIQIGFSPGQVTGTVSDNTGKPFAGAITVLIPAAKNRLDLYKTANSDQNGAVSFTNVAPGAYKVIAWEDVPQGAYTNADFVAPFEDRGQSVNVDRNTAPNVQIRVIPRNQQ
jgi:hypothetical protein